ncbi:hypothetical protein [Chitinophaga pinensis]|uniref:Uncharacterized protein n=1 Tax=Chitinophaga pinensis TaxID=79329 RepID=A0A5C6LZV0_9BACT|nr:hypothetical protein [Chitinophaga pinensis]TWW02140.1 hypothetical protein FEF09_03070 [Chitinophaga pinensis]
MRILDIPKELLVTDEEMKTMSESEILDRVGKIIATGKVTIPRLVEEGNKMADKLEAMWRKQNNNNL